MSNWIKQCTTNPEPEDRPTAYFILSKLKKHRGFREKKQENENQEKRWKDAKTTKCKVRERKDSEKNGFIFKQTATKKQKQNKLNNKQKTKHQTKKTNVQKHISTQY